MARGAPKAKGRGRGRPAKVPASSSQDVGSALVAVADINSLVAQAELTLPTTIRNRPNRRDCDDKACHDNQYLGTVVFAVDHSVVG